MTTIRQIITDAFRESGLVQVGLTPEADEFDEALRRLQGFILQLYGNEMGSPLTTINYGTEGVVQAYSHVFDSSNEYSSYFIPPNTQLVVNAGMGYTVYLNPMPRDGERVSVIDVGKNFATYPFTLDGNGRRIEADRDYSMTTNGDRKSWFYRGDLGKWTLVSNLTADSESPFPEEFDDYLSTSLAMRLNPRYGEQTAPETLQTWKRARTQFRARYKQKVPAYPDIALVRLSSRQMSAQGFSGRWGDNAG